MSLVSIMFCGALLLTLVAVSALSPFLGTSAWAHALAIVRSADTVAGASAAGGQ